MDEPLDAKRATVHDVARTARLTLNAVQYHARDPTALAARLDALDGRQTDCAVIVAPHREVRAS